MGDWGWVLDDPNPNHPSPNPNHMNKPFTGFSTDKQKTVRVPEGFFGDVLPQITSMLEMKVTLYLFWRLARGGANPPAPRMVSLSELEGEEKLKAALSQGCTALRGGQSAPSTGLPER